MQYDTSIKPTYGEVIDEQPASHHPEFTPASATLCSRATLRTLYPRDQAVWRFLLHQLSSQLSTTAHPVYLEGLKRTGINLETIPRIETMNDCLQAIGWRAVVVDGFVPPAIFMEFQAHKVLVIAVDMRSVEHMLYTPAPDIVHESAGHAPFIVDVDYAEFLQRFGELGMRAVASQGDMDVYEAIRHLSIIKETSSATEADIANAEQSLQTAIAANKEPSEAALLARLHWWTVEYGLVGELDNYRIFGAGLLSSLGESANCQDDQQVKKLPLTVDAVATAYDITTEQPQLFVTKNCRHLTQVLEEFARQMCVNQGGSQSLNKAINAKTVNTAVTNSGLEISGQFSRVLTDAMGNPTYLCTTGPTQLAYNGQQLEGHGTDHHAEGFGSPLGGLQGMERCLSSYTVDELKQHGIVIGDPVVLEFLSGIVVRGRLQAIVRQQQKNLLMSIDQCTVTALDGEVLFNPDWGIYDMAVGEDIVSVYGGSADQQKYPLYKAPSSQATIQQDYDAATDRLFDLYSQVRMARETSANTDQLLQTILTTATDEWLLLFEALELVIQHKVDSDLIAQLHGLLAAQAKETDPQKACLIHYGLERLGLTQ
ncbi:aromatic amino acid hydroxylase [Oceanicoccus sagamiensis]|uniref:aromatic amino acid hydroxylase n=1 Tax=Oceanicoccus sagamiensis TaxID=716816 RepID=UPI001F0A275E|nr:aromatic amino acid hydroxylase [Oceanicoccus sagamiensis]